MTGQQLIELVRDVDRWKGDPYTLAMQVLQRQKEDDAALAATHSEAAAAAILEQ